MTRETRERRRVIVKQLPDDYSARTKKTRTKIKFALEDAGIKTTVHLIRADLALIRATYRFLIGTETERASLLVQAGKGHPNVSAIRYFQKCGLDTWAKVLAAKAQAEAPLPTPATEAKDSIQLFLAAAQGIAEELRTTRSENQRFMADNLALSERVQTLEARIGGFDIAQLESFLSLARELQAGSRVHQPAPAEPPSNFPDGPKNAAAFNEKPVVYSDQFVRNYRQLDRNTRTEMLRVLKILLEQGPRNPTIKCGSKPGNTGLLNCKVHRMFIIWEDKPKGVHIHWIERAGQPICK